MAALALADPRVRAGQEEVESYAHEAISEKSGWFAIRSAGRNGRPGERRPPGGARKCAFCLPAADVVASLVSRQPALAHNGPG